MNFKTCLVFEIPNNVLWCTTVVVFYCELDICKTLLRNKNNNGVQVTNNWIKEVVKT